jgi:phage shock protein PspC (stress-responsive transcriptional regulator)
MKRIILLLVILFAQAGVMVKACPVCERQQPKITRGIIHGTGPDSSWDYVIVAVIAVITIITLFYSVKWLVKPGETEKQHIKYFILNNE